MHAVSYTLPKMLHKQKRLLLLLLLMPQLLSKGSL